MTDTLIFPLRSPFTEEFLATLTRSQNQLAYATLAQYCAQTLELSVEKTGRWEAYDYLRDTFQLSTPEISEDLNYFALFGRLQLSFAEWSEILRSFEEKKGEIDFHVWTARLLRYLNFEAFAQTHEKLWLDYHVLERYLAQESRVAPAPYLDSHLELYPLEKKVADKLRVRAPEGLSTLPLPVHLWNFEEKMPQGLEARLRIPEATCVLVNNVPPRPLSPVEKTEAKAHAVDVERYKLQRPLVADEARADALLLSPLEFALLPNAPSALLLGAPKVHLQHYERFFFPYRLRGLIEGSIGQALPSAGREEKKLQAVIATQHLSPRPGEYFTAPEIQGSAPQFRRALATPPRLSPSGLEAYARCPAAFAFSRLDKLDFGRPSEEKLDAKALGSLLHKVLERYLLLNDFVNRRELFLQLFREEKINFFPQISATLAIFLDSEIEILSDKLDRFVTDFEIPLAEFFPGRRLQVEVPLEVRWGDFQMRGRLDRVDELGPEQFFIWDYKSGRTSTKALTQIKNAKFQFFLYRKFFRPGVLGGGYLNPLDAGKSYLFLHEAAPRFTALTELFKRTGHPFEVLSTEQFATADELLEEKLAYVTGGLSEGLFPPQPLSPQLCNHCEFKLLCGRPFFAREDNL